MKKIEIYDTTLRDGTQGEGVNLSLQDKLDITVALDELGVDFVEGGWPGSNPKDVDFFNDCLYVFFIRYLTSRHSIMIH